MDASSICSTATCLTGRLRVALPFLVPSPLSASSSSSLSSWSCPLSWSRGHAASRSMKNVKGGAIAAAFEFDSYRIPFREGIPAGSKLKLFNLPYECDRDALIQHFATCGAVVESLEITERSDEKGNASGFVILKDLDQACAAVARLDGAIFQGKCVRMDFVERRPYVINPNKKPRSYGLNNSPYKIYVGNLPWTVDDASLKQMFSEYGTVQESHIVRESGSGRSRGYAFVGMSSSDEMKRAITALHGYKVEGRSLKVNAAARTEALNVEEGSS